jgi:hypothetical protein
MRISWATASAFAAYTCATWASGVAPQVIYTAEYTWLWWVPAFIWTLTAVLTAFGFGGD